VSIYFLIDSASASYTVAFYVLWLL